MRSTDHLIRELTHLVGRTRAFLGELAGTERELRLIRQPGAARVLAALVAVQDTELAGSLAAVERVATGLLKLLTAGDAETIDT